MSRLREKTTAILLIVLFLASLTAIAVPVYADTIEYTPEWNPFTIRDQDVVDSPGEVSIVISDLAVSGDLYVGSTLTLSGTVDMTAKAGIHGWWIHEAWACSWGSAALSFGSSQLHYEESPLKWADGYILSGWWWNIIPNDQSQTWDFSFDFTPTQTGAYTLKAFGHADAGYWRQHYEPEHPGWSWSDSENVQDLFTFEVVLGATVDIDPDTLNMMGNGQWITAYITPPEGYIAEDIVPGSVQIDGVALAWSEIQDGVFIAKFERALVQGEVTGMPDYDGGTKFQDIILTVTGELSDTEPFAGSDTVKVITK